MQSGAGNFRTVRCSADEGDPLKRILTLEAINTLEWMEDGYPNYHHQMMAYLQNYLQQGIAAGRFTREEAEHDLDFSLWMACACMNAGTYESYYRAWLWLRDTEKKAAGCGIWYYRYARAVMYLGRLEEALRYAEEGVRQQPENPWCWLMLGRLRSHFGDREGGLAATRHGFSYAPGDGELHRQEQMIREGCTLEEIESWPLTGLPWDALPQDKRESISGIVCNRENLRRILEIISPLSWKPDDPYCTFTLDRGEGKVLEGVFCMNEAFLSKWDADWIRETFAGLGERALADEVRLKRRHHIPHDAELRQVIIRRDQSVFFTYQFDETPPTTEQLFERPVCP